MRLDQVKLSWEEATQSLLEFYMGKNTMEKTEFHHKTILWCKMMLKFNFY